VARRDRSPKDKAFPTVLEFVSSAAATLQEIQDGLLARATELRDANTVKIDTWEEFQAFFTPSNADKPEIHGGFALAHWDGSREVEDQIKSELKVTVRCIPFDARKKKANASSAAGRANAGSFSRRATSVSRRGEHWRFPAKFTLVSSKHVPTISAMKTFLPVLAFVIVSSLTPAPRRRDGSSVA
jgi:hypothetical protein